jgi:hypothetical protein
MYCFTLFCLISVYFFVISKKNMNLVLKYPVFVKTSKNKKNNKKLFLCIQSSVSKLKKSYCVFHTPEKKYFNMHFGYNNHFIKVKGTLAKISKTTKILFCLSFSIRGMTLHIICIPDIKLFFSDSKTVRFYPIKIRSSLLRRAFLEF